jgi:hypothetical protein
MEASFKATIHGTSIRTIFKILIDGKWMLVMNEMLTTMNEFNLICMKMDETG